MSDVVSSEVYDWLAKIGSVVFLEEAREVVDFIEEGDPAVIGSVVF